MSSSLRKTKKFSKMELSSDSDYSSPDQNSEEFDSHDPKDKAISQKSKKMKPTGKKPRKLKNSAAQENHNKITGQEWNGKGKSINSQPVVPNDLGSKPFDIDDTESDYSENSDVSNKIGDVITSGASDGLTDSQMEGSDFSEPSSEGLRIEESKAGSGKPSKQKENMRIPQKSGKNKGPKDYSLAQPRGTDRSYPKNYTSREEKKIVQPRGGKKGRNGKKPGPKNKMIFKKKKIDSDGSSSSSDDALNQTLDKIIQPKQPRTKKQPPPVQSNIITFEESPMDTEIDPEEDQIKDSFMDLG